MFLVAVLVLLFLMYRFYTFRAEMVFIMTLLTPAMLLIGAYHLTGEYREAGIFLLSFYICILISFCIAQIIIHINFSSCYIQPFLIIK